MSTKPRTRANEQNQTSIDLQPSDLSPHDLISYLCGLTLVLLLGLITRDLWALHGAYTTVAILAVIFLCAYILTGDNQ